ncbi:MAG: hypothetical protein WC722_07235 [Rhodospirillales bacterium]|jgi:hypothetical protein
MKPAGSAFSQALHKRYVERAAFEVGEGDWSSVTFFNSRARSSVLGNPPAPQKVEERALKGGVDEIKAAHAKLVSALATKRNEAVKAALVKEGVDAKSIVMSAKGDTSLQVPTPTNTREPRNRRIEIVLQ